MTTIRDFIYLDAERLNSLYSQVFQGVVEAIVETELAEEEGKNAEQGGWKFSGSKVEERVAAASYKTQNRLLHDHMYNLFEEQTASAIADISEVKQVDHFDRVRDAFLVKVVGSAELWDFQRMKHFFDRFNEIGSAITYIMTFNPEGTKLLERTQTELETWLHARRSSAKVSPEMVAKREQLAAIKALLDPVQRAKANNHYLDPEYLKRISFLTEMFYSDSIEVVVQPRHGMDDVLVRGILDRQWFRRSPDLLRMLNAGHAAPDWIVVGQVTHVPRQDEQEITPSEEAVARVEEAGPEGEGERSGEVEAEVSKPLEMRDGYRGLVRGYYALEKTFSANATIIELVIHPLAIYREFTIPDTTPSVQGTDNAPGS